MKNLILFWGFLILSLPSFAQDDTMSDSTGLPGDQFSLQGALDLFKKAESPEDFEKLINQENNHVNNLDLNGDGDIDYVKVISKQDKDVQIFILQVSVSKDENQDIAVVELEKSENDHAVIQIVGDEEIYGEEIIVEANDDTAMNREDSKETFEKNNDDNPPVVVNVWSWPSVRYVYTPHYRPWVSPWRWRVYPAWWSPWRPLAWSVWHPFRARHYHHGFRVVHKHRILRAHNIYRPVRSASVTVRSRHAGAHANYKVTRTKTKVTGPRGNSVTKKTTTVRGAKGNVRGQKTTVKKSRRG